MPEMNLDDVHGELLNDDNQDLGTVDIPEDLEASPEEIDEVNLYDLSPDLYTDPAPKDSQANVETPVNGIDVVSDLLEAKGIDPAAIEYEDENGELQTVNFYDLPYEEQVGILNSEEVTDDYSDLERETIQFLRDNGVSLDEAIEYFQRKAVEEHINSENISGLEVDQYSNEELFALDLRSKYPELTNEEVDVELAKQLEHPEVFRKKVEQLRTDYKEIEASQLEQARSDQEQADEQRRQELEDTLVQTAISVEDLGGLTLDDDDKNDVLSFILEKDLNGYSAFIKSLNSPQTLFEAAWFVTKGKEAFNILHDYYKREISQVSKASYEKGRQSTQSSTTKPESTNPRKSFTRKSNSQTAQTSSSKPLSIEDITFE